MGFVPGSPPGTPGNMLGLNYGFPSGSDATLGVEDDAVPGSISLRQVAMGTVGYYDYTPVGDPDFGEYFGFGNSFWDSFNPNPPTHNSLDDGTPSVASFAQDTLPGNLVVCMGWVIGSEPFSFGTGFLSLQIAMPSFDTDGCSAGGIILVGPNADSPGSGYTYNDLLYILEDGIWKGGAVYIPGPPISGVSSSGVPLQYYQANPGAGYRTTTGLQTVGGHGTGAFVDVSLDPIDPNTNWSSWPNWALESRFARNGPAPITPPPSSGGNRMQSFSGLVQLPSGITIPAGQEFFAGLRYGDPLRDLTYQQILLEFDLGGADAQAFSANWAKIDPSAPASIKSQLPSTSSSLVITAALNLGDPLSAGSGFSLGPAPDGVPNGQWQWRQFDPQPFGYAGPQLPLSYPHYSGSPSEPDLGFAGSNASDGEMFLTSYVISVGAGGGGGGGGGGDVNEFLPNVWIVT